MTYDRVSIKEKAKTALRANYWPMVGISVAFPLLCGILAAIPVIGFVANLVIVPVVTTSYAYMCYKVYTGEATPSFEALLAGFMDNRFGKVLGGYWVVAIFTWLWSLLLIVPGIIKGIAYSMTPYILMEHPEMGIMDAINESKAMTEGHKMDIFVTYLSFIGWAILGSITFGIVYIFWVIPYVNLTFGGIYAELKGPQINVNEASENF